MPKKKRAKKRARSRAHRAKKPESRKRVDRTRPRTSRKVPPARRSRKGKARSRKSKEFLRRSKASKKGWRKHKAKKRIAEQAKRKPTGKGKLREWIVNFSYFGAKTSRILGFTVIARNEQDALTFVYKAIAKGEDSTGSDLTWVSRIDWSEVDVTKAIEDEEKPLRKKEIKELGEGWVETH